MFPLFLALLVHYTVGGITGTVVTPELQPLQGADISLLGNSLQSTTSDENGSFTLDFTSSSGLKSHQSSRQSIHGNNRHLILTLNRKETTEMELFTLGGRKVLSLFSGILSAGEHRLELPIEKSAHQNMLLRATVGRQTSVFHVSPSGIAGKKSHLKLKKSTMTARSSTDSLVITHPDYPTLTVPVADSDSLGRIIMIDSVSGTATSIRAVLYSTDSMDPIDTLEEFREGAVNFSGVIERFPEFSEFIIFAEATGFYTEIYSIDKNKSLVFFDLDSVPKAEGNLAGVLIGRLLGWNACYSTSTIVTLRELNKKDTTDSEGRYLFSNVPSGDYHIDFNNVGSDFTFSASVNSEGYKDFCYREEIVVRAPNVYLYPETTSQISLSVSFPQGGEVILSEPEYNQGWNVTAEPTGMIDDTVPFLFYEARMDGPFTFQEGWVIDQNDLSNELVSLLEARGFAGREIDDFLQFWIPVLEDAAPYFAVYPQDVESLIEHHVSPQPESVRRELWYICSLQAPLQIKEPAPVSFERNGFTLTEWGVMLSNDLNRKAEGLHDQ